MTEYANLLYEVENCVGTITINRPKALNALNSQTLQELDALLTDIAADSGVKAVIIRGSGEKSFIAGADITEMRELSAMEGRAFGKLGQKVFRKIENLPKPVIAAINGFALGGGCELAMACDIRIATEKSKFGQPEVMLGVIPGFGGSQRLPRLVGIGRAKELLYAGDQINAQEAYRIGLINQVVKEEELMNAVLALAQKIAARAPLAVELCKEAVNVGMNLDLDSAIELESELFGLCFATADQKEGMGAFVEKRKAVFTSK